MRWSDGQVWSSLQTRRLSRRTFTSIIAIVEFLLLMLRKGTSTQSSSPNTQPPSCALASSHQMETRCPLWCLSAKHASTGVSGCSGAGESLDPGPVSRSWRRQRRHQPRISILLPAGWCSGAHSSQDCCVRPNFGSERFWDKTRWPPLSPDANPLDYSVWNEVVRIRNSGPHSNLDSLRNAILPTWNGLSSDFIREACSAFRGRLERIIAADGLPLSD